MGPEQGAFEFSKIEPPYHWYAFDYFLSFFWANITVLTSLFLHDTATEGAEGRIQVNQREGSVFHQICPSHSFIN